MSDHVDPEEVTSAPGPAGTETVEAYETDDGVVLYDAENPLAWVEATESLTLREQT